MIDENHPYYFLKKVINETEAQFFLSAYIYIPDTLFDERETFSVISNNFSEGYVSQKISNLLPSQELALHSKVLIKGRTWHIPMIDFSIDGNFQRDIFNRMSDYLSKPLILNMAIYDSGRSYHAYSSLLISPKEWINFMGKLLLINQKNKKPIIDTRWVGHRLIGGFAALRWSNNSGQYEGMPTRISLSKI